MAIQHPTKYLTDRDLAARYRISRASVWNWCKSGIIPPPRKFGTQTRWDIAELEAHEAVLTGGVK
jgi:predicted DNA-binding transcriptional regulator AlpA